MNVSRVLLSSRRPLTSVRPLASVSSDYDAVIIGGGHNGLVAAAYLAKSGLKTCVLERRHVVGGAAVTEEIIPGYKFSRASYVLSLLRPQIFDDLELKRHGLKVHLRSPSSYTPINKKYLRPGGPTSLILGASSSEDHRQIAQFSERDARKYAEFEDQLNRFVDAIDPLLDHNPINTKVIAEANVFQKVAMLVQMPHLVKAGRVLSTEIREFYELMTAPASKILDKWFESEPLKATLATDSCIGAMISPDSPGSGYVLLHHVMGGLEGIRGAWGYPQGGMGAVSDAIANSAVESGATIRTSTPVREIVMESGSAKGVVLEDGSVVASKIVLSNATPRVTFQSLLAPHQVPRDFLNAIERIDYTSPVTKINVAVDRLPNFIANPNTQGSCPMPHHRGTIHLNCENSAMVVEAYDDAVKEGRYSRKPLIEMTIPSSLDPTIAPEGGHVCLFFTQYTPYTLADGRTWTADLKEEYADLIFNTVEEYAPGFKESIVGKEVLPPPELERIFGLTGGNIFHGAMSLDQLYMNRPVLQDRLVSPSTPLEGLFMCGSGAHPGGGVMGAPGRLAAKAVTEKMNVEWKFN